MPDLPKIDPMALVRNAFFELTAAVSQSIPADDQIMMQRVRNAHVLLDQIVKADGARK